MVADANGFRHRDGRNRRQLTVRSGAALAGGMFGLLMAATPSTVSAQTWTGAVNSDWAEPGNWSSNAVPGVNDVPNILFGALANQPVITTNQTVNTTVLAAGSLTVSATLNSIVNATGGRLLVTAGGRVNGVVTVSADGSNAGAIDSRLFTVNGGTFTNTGTLGQLNVTGTGILNLNAGSVLSLTEFTEMQSGNLNVNANVTGGSLNGTGGTVTIANGAVFTIDGQGGLSSTFDGVVTGAGRLVKTGGGTLTLTGASNSFSGGVTINSGSAVQIGAGAAQGTLGTGAVTMDGLLVFNRTDTFIVSNAISGAATGDLATIAAGTTILTGANTYAGITRILAGTLQIGNGGTTGALGAGNVTNNATLTFNRSNAITVASAISGTGALNQIGAGATTLTGANSYTGATNINAGTLIAANSTALGGNTAAVTVQNGATLGLQGGVSVGAKPLFIIGAGAGGGGALRNVSGDNAYAGLVTLNGASRINSDAGTLRLTGGVFADAAVTFGGAGNIVVSGAITGTGSLTKDGSGTLTLTGMNTYSGATTINAGTLVVNGVINSTVTLNGGALGGSGQVAGVIAAAGSVLSPGNSPGTLTIAGNLTLGAGSTYRAEVQGAQADRITVTGTATINAGATLQIVPLGGAYSFGAPYVLLSAAGGITGGFGTVTGLGDFGAGITAAVSTTPGSILLTLTALPLTPIVGGVLVPATQNQTNVARRLDGAVAAGFNPAPFFALYNLPAGQMAGALNQLSGEGHAAAQRAALDDERLVREAVLNRMRGGDVTASASGARASATGAASAPTATALPARPPPAAS